MEALGWILGNLRSWDDDYVGGVDEYPRCGLVRVRVSHVAVTLALIADRCGCSQMEQRRPQD